MSKITEYYTLHGVDDKDRTLLGTLLMGPEFLENSHDFIQWVFPTDRPSGCVPGSPVLTLEDIDILRGNSISQSMIVFSFYVWTSFLGFDYTGKTLEFSPNSLERETVWCRPNNHNHLRITRSLLSLHLFGRDDLAKLLFNFLNNWYRKNQYISSKTWAFWDEEMENIEKDFQKRLESL